MSSWVTYEGKGIGRITLMGSKPVRWAYVAESLEDLATLFQIPPEAEVEFEGPGKITFRELYDRHLKDITMFFPDRNSFFYGNVKADPL